MDWIRRPAYRETTKATQRAPESQETAFQKQADERLTSRARQRGMGTDGLNCKRAPPLGRRRPAVGGIPDVNHGKADASILMSAVGGIADVVWLGPLGPLIAEAVEELCWYR